MSSLDLAVGKPQRLVLKKAVPGDPETGEIKLDVLLAKYIDDFHTATRIESMIQKTPNLIKGAVQIGTWKQWPKLLDVNSTEVLQAKTSVTVHADRLHREIEVIELAAGLRKNISAK